MNVWLIPAIVFGSIIAIICVVAAISVYQDRKQLRHWADEQRRKPRW